MDENKIIRFRLEDSAAYINKKTAECKWQVRALSCKVFRALSSFPRSASSVIVLYLCEPTCFVLDHMPFQF